MNNIVKFESEKEQQFLFDEHIISVCPKDDYSFSVVTAVYNAAEYISETIDSIIQQDFGFENIQLILVDDGSKDNSFEICEKYANKYPDNIVLVSKPNGGVSSARNAGMKYVKGKYINFIDSDDKFSLDTFRKVFDFFEAHENQTDVVTIPNELFGDKVGDTWFNAKFKKGTRLINLWNEPQVFLNSVNNTFFHRRISNQLNFDTKLSISEDLKVVNTVLTTRWTLGVVADCKYYYRIRSAAAGSLASSARMKECWYFTYLERVFFWLYEKTYNQCRFFPETTQYTLLRDIYNRFNDNKECVFVIKTKEEMDRYKELLFKALSLIDDKVILNNNFLNTDYIIYFLAIKHGEPLVSVCDDKVEFTFESGTKVTKKLFVSYQNCDIIDNKLVLEGYVILNNFRQDLDNYIPEFFFGDKKIDAEFFPDCNNKLAFGDENIFTRRFFKLSFDVKKRNFAPIKAFITYNNIRLPVSISGYDKWFGISAKAKHSYFYKNGILLTDLNGVLNSRKASPFSSLISEIRYLASLKKLSGKSEEAKKGLFVRLYYHVMRFFTLRKVWIISDRNTLAGDNGEAFYDYLKKKKPFINKYFALRKESTDFSRLSKKKFKLLDFEDRKYKKKFLIADAIISSHFDRVESEPINTDYIKDIIAKKKFVFLQHGIIKDDLSGYYSRKNFKFDMFVTSATAEYDSIVNQSAYFCDENVVKLTGLPRYDNLDSKATEKIILVMPTWRFGMKADEEHKQAFLNSYYYNFFYKLMTDEKLASVMSEHGYTFEYFAHQNLIGSNSYFKRLKNVIIPNECDRNYSDAFSKCAIMVTDYSSTAFDFAYLRKPIVYCQGDREEFFSSHTYKKGYFDYSDMGFGKVTYSVDQAVEEIINLIKNDAKADSFYLERMNSFFPFNDKDNCKRTYKAITKLK